jgi:arginine/lysine/ornithine decarboxylase
MASLDAWQAFLRDGGIDELRRTEELALALAGGIRAIGDYRLWQDELPAGMKTDPRKITLSSRELGIDGFSLAEALRRDYAIDVELAAEDYILLIVGIGHDEPDIYRMVNALSSIGAEISAEAGKGRENGEGDKGGSESKREIYDIYGQGKTPWRPVISPREAYFNPREKVRLENSPGRLAAVTVAPYPPGVPILFPGMEISRETMEKIVSMEETGVRCAGLAREGNALYIDVVHAI